MAKVAAKAIQMDVVEAEHRSSMEAAVAIVSATEAGLIQEIGEAKESYAAEKVVAEEPRTDEVAPKVDVAMAKVEAERPMEAATEEVATEITPATDVPLIKWMKEGILEPYLFLLLRPRHKECRRYPQSTPKT